MKTTALQVVSALALVLIAVMGCTNQEAVAESTAPEEDAVAGGKVSKIVFLDLSNACPCTEERIDIAWDALQAALKATNAAIPVERLHVDTQGEQADVYRKLKPMVTAPAIYLLDAAGGLVELLQGEVTTEQIAKLLR